MTSHTFTNKQVFGRRLRESGVVGMKWGTRKEGGYKGRIQTAQSNLKRWPSSGGKQYTKALTGAIKSGVANARAYGLLKKLNARTSWGNWTSGFSASKDPMAVKSRGEIRGQRYAAKAVRRLAKVAAAYPRAAKRFGKNY